MGASGSKKIKNNTQLYIPALLVSFTKINEFNNYFKYQKDKGKLTKIFHSLINSIDLLDGHVLEFNKIKDSEINNKDNISIKKLIDFILDKLHNELNDLNNQNNNIEQKINDTNEEHSYHQFKDFYYKNNRSIIQDLFYGEKETISRCSKCKETTYNFSMNKFLYFDIHSYKNQVDLNNLIKDYGKQEEIMTFCKKCQKNTDVLTRTIIKKLPEIFIISFDNFDGNSINYYLNLIIQDEPYILICFIINADECNLKDENYHVFYRENENWFNYNVIKKQIKQINKIVDINKNPLVTFYQKKITYDKIIANNFYVNLSELFNYLKGIPELLKNHIEDEKNFCNYYLINKRWINKLCKIFESEETYKDDNLIFDSFNQVTNILNLDITELKKKITLMINRRDELKNENIFIPEYETNKESGIKYPNNFIIIEEKELNKLLKTLKLDINLDKILYQIIIGENYLFVKSKENNNIYYICFSIIFLFNVERIFRFNEDKYFGREIKQYIKDRGGLDFYFEERNLDVEKKDIQQIIDKENEYIGDLINIINNNTLIEINKYFLNKN